MYNIAIMASFISLLPFQILLHNSVNLCIDRINFCITLNKTNLFDKLEFKCSPFTINVTEYDLASPCADVYLSTVFSGYCSLPSQCYAVETKTLEHTWYGESVVICAGIDKTKLRHPIYRERLELCEIDYTKVVDYFAGIGVYDLDVDYMQKRYKVFRRPQSGSGTAYYHTLVLSDHVHLLSELSLLNRYEFYGDWHSIIYKRWPITTLLNFYVFYPTHTLKSSKLNSYNSVLSLRFKSFRFRYSCDGGGGINNSYDLYECSKYIPLKGNSIICEYGFTGRSISNNVCPTIFVPQTDRFDMFNQTLLIRTHTTNVFTHAIESLLNSVYKIMEDIISALLDLATPLVALVVEHVCYTLITITNDLIKIINQESQAFDNLISSLCNLLKLILSIIVKIILKLDESIMFVELLIFALILQRFVKDIFISCILIVIVLPFIPFFRIYPSILNYIFVNFNISSNISVGTIDFVNVTTKL